jgi:hypothetical protein
MNMNTRRVLMVLASVALVAAATQQPLAARATPPMEASSASGLGGWSAPFRVLPAGDGALVSCSSGLFCTAASYDGSAAQGHGMQLEFKRSQFDQDVDLGLATCPLCL